MKSKDVMNVKYLVLWKENILILLEIIKIQNTVENHLHSFYLCVFVFID